jgi:hypothetical protein
VVGTQPLPAHDWPLAGWRRIGPKRTAKAGAVAAVSHSPNHLDVFVVGNDDAV